MTNSWGNRDLLMLKSFLNRIPLTPKMLLITVLAGTVIWGVMENYQSKELGKILHAQQEERLKHGAQDARILFDGYIAAYSKVARLIIAQKKFSDYLQTRSWFSAGPSALRHYSEIPPWLPDASVLRQFARIHYAFLLDGKNNVREVYAGWPKPVPDSLMRPEAFLLRLISEQSLMLNVDGAPFVLTAESLKEPLTGRRVTLMFASPLNDDFLISSQGFSHSMGIVALVAGKVPRIIASSNPDVLPSGAQLETLKDRFLITGKSFFDGAADLSVQFTSFISKEEYENLSRSILLTERRQSLISALILILSFAGIMFWITRHIRRLSQDIKDFSQEVLGAESGEMEKGDELLMLRERFRRLTGEVAVSRNALLKERDQSKNAHQELQAAQSQILQREKMASIGQLAAGVAHEINNPMGFIISNLGTLGKYTDRVREFVRAQAAVLDAHNPEQAVGLDELRRKLKMDYILEDTKNLVSESLEGAERVKKIVQNLKSFSRLDETGRKMSDINSCLESTMNIVWNELKYKASVRRELGDIPQTLCNPGELNQVFLNLLVNAADAIGERGEITVRTDSEDGRIIISISDTGCGIPAKNLNRIFEPFFTTKEVGKGTGLGLSITYDIIKKHGGNIDVCSEEGKGTTFIIDIPVEKC